jgi:hypothetical protein
MSVRTAALNAARLEGREDSLVLLARLIVYGEAHRLARIHDLAHLLAGGENTADAAPGRHAVLAKRLASDTSLPILLTGTQVNQGSDCIRAWSGVGGSSPWRLRHSRASATADRRRYRLLLPNCFATKASH